MRQQGGVHVREHKKILCQSRKQQPRQWQAAALKQHPLAQLWGEVRVVI